MFRYLQEKKPLGRRLALYLIDAWIIATVLVVMWGTAYLADFVTMCTADVLFSLVSAVVFYEVLAVIFKVNSTIWRYAGGHDYIFIFAVTAASGILAYFFDVFIGVGGGVRMLDIFSVPLYASGVTFSRVVYREQKAGIPRRGVPADAKRLMIVGAGNAGSRIVEEIRQNPSCGLYPVCFCDDDLQKMGRSIQGIRIEGTISDAAYLAKEKKIDLIYIAIPSASNEKRAEILEKCLSSGCPVKILPLLTELEDRRDIIDKVRDITPEELLGREPVEVADESIMEFVKGKTVVITGGGGSIGSELCRQVASHSPRRLVIIDVYENNAYSIEQELIRKYGDKLSLAVYIATVCDYAKIAGIFSVEKPELVIHAAAHKHVPLMETVPDECVKNNVFGTYNTVMAASRYKVKKFILISTDKAVNPTNIMGATKRVCEMIVRWADEMFPDTTFAAVRFGNVLGSNGSVIPLFKEQIEAGVDVTVTHPDIIRYFMTITEASQLVLTAGAYAKGGEVFVLDMGKPVKIDDLARKMIALSGLTLGKDINIRYIGLRPGEKLYEELLMNEEGLERTANKKIFIGKPIELDAAAFENELKQLKAAAEREGVTPAEVEAELMKIVPTFVRRHEEAQIEVIADKNGASRSVSRESVEARGKKSGIYAAV